MYTSERVKRDGHEVRIVEQWVANDDQFFKEMIDDCKQNGRTRCQIELIVWLSWVWYEVVGSGDPRHLRAGTNCQQIKSSDGVMYYASKYISKLDTDAVGNAGRFWGLHNVSEIPWAEAVQVPLDAQQAVRVMRVARRYIWTQQRQREHPRKIHWRANCGMTFFCDASWWLQRLPSIAGG